MRVTTATFACNQREQLMAKNAVGLCVGDGRQQTSANCGTVITNMDPQRQRLRAMLQPRPRMKKRDSTPKQRQTGAGSSGRR